RARVVTGTSRPASASSALASAAAVGPPVWVRPRRALAADPVPGVRPRARVVRHRPPVDPTSTPWSALDRSARWSNHGVLVGSRGRCALRPSLLESTRCALGFWLRRSHETPTAGRLTSAIQAEDCYRVACPLARLGSRRAHLVHRERHALARKPRASLRRCQEVSMRQSTSQSSSNGAREGVGAATPAESHAPMTTSVLEPVTAWKEAAAATGRWWTMVGVGLGALAGL